MFRKLRCVALGSVKRPDFPPSTRLLPLAATLVLTLGGIPIAGGGIYRWTDAEGQVQISDRLPPGGIKDSQEISEKYEGHVPFSFEIIPVGFDIPPDTRVKVEVAVSKIHEILRSRLSLDFRTDPSFKIRIFKDRKSYASYAEGPPLGGMASGYYIPQRKEVVTWRQHSFEQMLEVITHEASHALMRHRFGEVPPWLNEGLSEYFERMEVFAMAVVIHPNPQWDQLVREEVRNGSIEPLRQYMALSQQGWQLNNVQDNRSYAQAWSLVYFLMSTPEGTRLLGRLLDTLDRVGAADFSAVDAIDTNFNGGLAVLESRWLAAALSPKPAHHY